MLFSNEGSSKDDSKVNTHVIGMGINDSLRGA